MRKGFIGALYQLWDIPSILSLPPVFLVSFWGGSAKATVETLWRSARRQRPTLGLRLNITESSHSHIPTTVPTVFQYNDGL